MSVQLYNTKLSEYGETIYSINPVETLQHIYDLADAKQDLDLDGNKWLHADNKFVMEWIEMSLELATKVVKALKKEGNVELANQLDECIDEARLKWKQEVVRLELW